MACGDKSTTSTQVAHWRRNASANACVSKLAADVDVGSVLNMFSNSGRKALAGFQPRFSPCPRRPSKPGKEKSFSALRVRHFAPGLWFAAT